MSRKKYWAMLAVLVALSCFVLLPCVVHESDLDMIGHQSRIHLAQIGQAMHQYHDHFHELPPAVKCDKDGKPLYSWRVLLLPYLEEGSLYNEYHLNEPWDSVHNKYLMLAKMPPCYYSFRDEGNGMTRYQALVGPGTAFERPGLTWTDFPHGLGTTLLVVEAAQAVPWTKPEDVVYDPNKPLPSLGGVSKQDVRFLCRSIGSEPGFNAVFADSTVRFIRKGIDEKTIRALITRHGGEKVDLSRLD
jgi:hypothetical protein